MPSSTATNFAWLSSDGTHTPRLLSQVKAKLDTALSDFDKLKSNLKSLNTLAEMVLTLAVIPLVLFGGRARPAPE